MGLFWEPQFCFESGISLFHLSEFVVFHLSSQKLCILSRSRENLLEVEWGSEEGRVQPLKPDFGLKHLSIDCGPKKGHQKPTQSTAQPNKLTQNVVDLAGPKHLGAPKFPHPFSWNVKSSEVFMQKNYHFDCRHCVKSVQDSSRPSMAANTLLFPSPSWAISKNKLLVGQANPKRVKWQIVRNICLFLVPFADLVRRPCLHRKWKSIHDSTRTGKASEASIFPSVCHRLNRMIDIGKLCQSFLICSPIQSI